MKKGYRMIAPMLDELLAFMDEHGFETLDDFKGHAVPYVTTHAELVRMQAEAQDKKRAVVAEQMAEKAKAKEQEAVIAGGKEAVVRDENWDEDSFVEQSDELAGN